MTLATETKYFLGFVFLGMIFCVVFDIFRAIRKNKKVTDLTICMQDILYFLIIGSMLIFIILNFLDTDIRLYLFLAIIIGAMIYFSVIGNKVLNLVLKLFKFSSKIKEFIILPLTVYNLIFNKQIKIFKKYVIKCCKKISYMVNFKCIKSKIVILKKKLLTKEDRLNGKKQNKAS